MVRNRVSDTILLDNYFIRGRFDVLICSLVRMGFEVEGKTADSLGMLLNCSLEVNRNRFAFSLIR